MKTYVQPWICKVEGASVTLLQSQSTDKTLQVSETEITDSDQILSKEMQWSFDLWGDSFEEQEE